MAELVVPKIEKLDELISGHIGRDKKIIDSKITRLTAPGENFGSEMLKVDLRLKSTEGKEEDLHVVAKLIPENEFSRAIFNVDVSFNVEKEFYNSIVPTLQDFQRKQGITKVIDCFPRLYGARNNLGNNGEKVDNNAALVLENLKIQGFDNIDRIKGFDLATTKMILKCLAEFHAIPVAIKVKDTKTFEKNIKAYMSCNFPAAPKPPVEDLFEVVYNTLQDKTYEKFVPKIQESAKKFSLMSDEFREPFATISHRDLWVNNIMVKQDENTTEEVKIVDFQLYSYDSPAADIFFFLFSSVNFDVLRYHLDNLLHYYQQHFQSTLKNLNCDLDFSYQKFIEELGLATSWELAHTIFMVSFVINGPKGGIPMPKDMNEKQDLSHIKLPDFVVDRVKWILSECDRRNWLKF
ncbi:unnamed protein product [Diabrotica balteata]|uniref:CHK kinase-like domain-containing protein n=1 Tax=Diabrotica balteata TaxID=107213 RepID=A0A9N9SX30_DIABA|nr:unnamed protein product [Diabrotica balteata]